ncbi:hypothetical protein SAMN02745975_02478 [Geosporobacter subterraneus DSM 17957]|uniref:Uncharacterized protein n=1 Tax=Geosporobacter subterraneus DSM 17957 TaxID=1121919 RepID=A0A1M6KRS3_9FIRM|nr:hypothetical protein [Geosporobacter subterraneus]SHJ61632.1 hypothetical protein SAMN02745975_02478 [Geosporobacter subterraneus DSM 17957]
MNYKISIDEGKHKYGYIKGKIENYNWYALVHREKIDVGIDPLNLQSGLGRVSRLCIYKEVIDHGGNPYLPTSSIRRFIYANYKREWDVLSSDCMDMTRELVNYLERRYSLRIVK